MIINSEVFRDLQAHVEAARRAMDGLEAEVARREIRIEWAWKQELQARMDGDPVAESLALRRQNELILQLGDLQRMRHGIANACGVLVASLNGVRTA